MNRLIIGSMAALLSFGAVACSSSTKSSSTTGAATTGATISGSSTAASTGDSTVASSETAGPIGTKQAAVLAKTEAEMTQANLTFDAACVSNLVAQLSDEDADLILAAVPPATVTASPAGEAIGKQIGTCITAPTSDVVSTT